MTTDSVFWDGIAAKYRAQPIRDEDAYEITLDRVASQLTPKDRVLELGCGTGGTALRLAPVAGEIVATDFSPGMIAQAKERDSADNVTFLATDVHDAQFAPGSFNAVMAFNLLHLVRDVDRDLERIHALLPKGGLFISKTPCLTDPSAPLKWRVLVRLAIPVLQMLGKAPFVQFRSIADWDALIESHGFEIVETGNYPERPPNHFVVARKL